MFFVELRWLLLLLIALPLLSIAVTVGVLHWLGQRRRNQEILTTLQPLLDHAPIGCVLISRDSSLSYTNSYAQRLLGTALADPSLLSEHLASLKAADHASSAKRAGAYHTLEMDMSLPLVLHSNTPKQRIRWWITEWSGTTVAFFLDKTGQEQIEQKFNLMLGRLSHELRTPLETISLHLEVMGLPKTTDEQKRESLDYAKQELLRLRQLSNSSLELVGLANETSLETKLIYLPVLVDEVVSQVAGEAQKKAIHLQIESEASLPAVIGQAGKLKQVFINLFNNSIHHGCSGDTVTIRLAQNRAGIVCTVHDTGPGIAAHHLPRLTEPFYRVLSDYPQSTGLGLAIVSEILHQHQSHLTIESVSEKEAIPGQETGTRVQFVLPKAAEGVL